VRKGSVRTLGEEIRDGGAGDGDNHGVAVGESLVEGEVRMLGVEELDSVAV